MFQGFPEIKEALMSNKMQAAFMVAPMAIALRAQGVPVKIVYLGHRYGSAVVVRKGGPVHRVSDLRGRILAIPSRFSDERLIVFRALAANGMNAKKDLRMVEMAPPDVAGALAANAIDAFSMGEPFPSQAEIGGFGRVLFHAREYWPDYISCVLVVRQDAIDRRPEAVQTLVDGIARSGLWLDEKDRAKRHRLPAPLGAHEPDRSREVRAALSASRRFRDHREADGGDRRSRSRHPVRGVRRYEIRRGRACDDGVEVRSGRRSGEVGGTFGAFSARCAWSVRSSLRDSFPELDAALCRRFSKRPVVAAQHEFPSLCKLQVRSVIDRQMMCSRQL